MYSLSLSFVLDISVLFYVERFPSCSPLPIGFLYLSRVRRKRRWDLCFQVICSLLFLRFFSDLLASRFLLTILLLISLRNHIFVLLENKTKRTLTMCRYYLINIIFWLDVRFVCDDWGPRRPCKEDSRSQTELSVLNSLAHRIIEVHAFWLVKCTLRVQCDIENWELNVFNEETCKTKGMQFLG